MIEDVRDWVRRGRQLLHTSVLQVVSEDELSEHDRRQIDGLVLKLLGRGVNAHALNNDKETPMHVAARSQWPGSKNVIHILVDYGADIEAQNEHGATVLSIASGEGSHEVVGYLIREGAQLNAQTSDGDTPLHRAIRNGNVDSMRELLLAGASQLVKNSAGETTKTIPCSAETSNAYRDVMLERFPAQRKQIDEKEGLRARENVSRHDGSAPTTTRSLNLDTLSAEIRDWRGRDAELLLTAVEGLLGRGTPDQHEGIYEEVDLLIRRGVDLTAHNGNGATALHIAARSKAAAGVDVVALLVENGAGLEGRNYGHKSTPLMNACREGSFETVSYLIKKANLDARDAYGRTALHQVVRTAPPRDGQARELKIVRILILAGADTKISDSKGQSAETVKCTDDMRTAFTKAVKLMDDAAPTRKEMKQIRKELKHGRS